MTDPAPAPDLTLPHRGKRNLAAEQADSVHALIEQLLDTGVKNIPDGHVAAFEAQINFTNGTVAQGAVARHPTIPGMYRMLGEAGRGSGGGSVPIEIMFHYSAVYYLVLPRELPTIQAASSSIIRPTFGQ